MAECPRVHEVSNAILRSSLGGFCDDRGGAASPLLCPARCRVREALYAELDTFPAGGGGAANACPTLGQPCLGAAASNNATCCVLELEAFSAAHTHTTYALSALAKGKRYYLVWYAIGMRLLRSAEYDLWPQCAVSSDQ